MNEHLKTTWTHIRRSPYQALAAIGIMTLTFLVASIVILAAAGSQTILQWFETRPQVTAFFEDEIGLTEVESLKAKLLATGKVKEVKYVSQEEALIIYREENKDDPLLLEMVTANILPASLEIAPTDITHLQEIAQILESESGIEEIDFQEDVVGTLKKWTDNLRKVGLGLLVFLGIESFLIILVIISMKVALRKDEIEILQLIGADSWYVRAPFVFEGIFYGLVSAFLAWGLTYLLLLYSAPILVEFLADIPLFPVPVLFMLALLGAEILTGFLIGTLSSFLAVKRFLR